MDCAPDAGGAGGPGRDFPLRVPGRCPRRAPSAAPPAPRCGPALPAGPAASTGRRARRGHGRGHPDEAGWSSRPPRLRSCARCADSSTGTAWSPPRCTWSRRRSAGCARVIPGARRARLHPRLLQATWLRRASATLPARAARRRGRDGLPLRRAGPRRRPHRSGLPRRRGRAGRQLRGRVTRTKSNASARGPAGAVPDAAAGRPKGHARGRGERELRRLHLHARARWPSDVSAPTPTTLPGTCCATRRTSARGRIRRRRESPLARSRRSSYDYAAAVLELLPQPSAGRGQAPPPACWTWTATVFTASTPVAGDSAARCDGAEGPLLCEPRVLIAHPAGPRARSPRLSLCRRSAGEARVVVLPDDGSVAACSPAALAEPVDVAVSPGGRSTSPIAPAA